MAELHTRHQLVLKCSITRLRGLFFFLHRATSTIARGDYIDSTGNR